jgi:hypothetical protein
VAAVAEYPTVSVAAAVIRDEDDEPVADSPHLQGLIEVWCSEHGALTDWLSDLPITRDRARRTAAAHAVEAHDNLVDAVGWVR